MVGARERKISITPAWIVTRNSRIERQFLTEQEATVAKGQNRGNREPKKPKSKKPAVTTSVSILSPKGITPQSNLPKKKM
jgi:hypothetical protein